MIGMSEAIINKTELVFTARSKAETHFKKIENYGRFKSYSETYKNPIRNILDTIIRDKKQFSLEDIVFPSNRNDKNVDWSHSVSLCGKGGTGKTHQFLNLIREILYGKKEDGKLKYSNIVPFYIELNDINNLESISDNVIIDELSRNLDINEDSVKQLLASANEQVLIFADGMNEVNNREKRNAIARSICNIRADFRTRIILSSREDHSYVFNNLGRGLAQVFEKVEISNLSEEQINHYLEGENISVRYKDISPLTRKLLLTAQGLSMYAELIKEKPDRILEFKTLGSLLQSYCDWIMQITRYDTGEDLSFEDSLSYIAYNMVLKGVFQIYDKELKELLTETNRELQVDDDKISKIFVKHKDKDDTCIKEEEYEFTHQNFRDYYAALFLAKKIIIINEDNVLVILKKYFQNDDVTSNDEILSLCSDFSNAETIQRVINILKSKKNSDYSYSLSVFIRVYALMNQNNISSIDLDSLDLTNVSLSNYKLYSYNTNASIKLNNTKISEDTFLQNGLQTASSTICKYKLDNKDYICAFSASNALIYDIENNSWECIRNLPSEGWVNCCCVTMINKQTYILLGCRKNTISVFNPKSKTKERKIDFDSTNSSDIESIYTTVGSNGQQFIIASNACGEVFIIDKTDLFSEKESKIINSFDKNRIHDLKGYYKSRGLSLTSRLTMSNDYLYLCFGNEILRCKKPINQERGFESFKEFSNGTIIKDIMYSEGKLFINLGSEITLVDCNDIDADVDTFKLEPEKGLHHFTKFSNSDEAEKVIVGVSTINNDYSNISNFYKISQEYDPIEEQFRVFGAPINGLQTLATYTGVYFTLPRSNEVKLATVSDDRSVQIITPDSEDTETIIHKGSYDGIHYVDVIKENEILLAQYDGSVSHWKRNKNGVWRCINVFTIHKDWVWKVQHYFNDNVLCFISCSYDGTLKTTNTNTGDAETLLNLSLSYSTHPILDFELIFDNNNLKAIWSITDKNVYLWNSDDKTIKDFNGLSDNVLNKLSFRSISITNGNPFLAVNTQNLNDEVQCYIAEIENDTLKISVNLPKECGFIRCLKTVRVNDKELIIVGGNKNKITYLEIYENKDNRLSLLDLIPDSSQDGIQLSDFAEINDFILTDPEIKNESDVLDLYVAYKNNTIAKFFVSIKKNKATLTYERKIVLDSQPLAINIRDSQVLVGKLNGELAIFDNSLKKIFKIKTYANLDTCVKVNLTKADFGCDEDNKKFKEHFRGYFEFDHEP